jgi:hypothetical protein
MMSGSDTPSAMSFIRRFQRTSDDTPPWNGIMFTQPVDSDKLSEDLKRTYPSYSTLRERKHMAAIDFLQAELREMKSKYPDTPVTEALYLATPEESSPYSYALEDRSRNTSVSSSFSNVNTTQEPANTNRNIHRNSSMIAPSSPLETNAAQQFVFSVSDGHYLQPKTKRRMTKEEKAVYRKTRKRGACTRCQRQKSKVGCRSVCRYHPSLFIKRSARMLVMLLLNERLGLMYQKHGTSTHMIST